MVRPSHLGPTLYLHRKEEGVWLWEDPKAQLPAASVQAVVVLCTLERKEGGLGGRQGKESWFPFPRADVRVRLGRAGPKGPRPRASCSSPQRVHHSCNSHPLRPCLTPGEPRPGGWGRKKLREPRPSPLPSQPCSTVEEERLRSKVVFRRAPPARRSAAQAPSFMKSNPDPTVASHIIPEPTSIINPTPTSPPPSAANSVPIPTLQRTPI